MRAFWNTVGWIAISVTVVCCIVFVNQGGKGSGRWIAGAMVSMVICNIAWWRADGR